MLKYMDYAYAVYKERSFTKAAEKLYISQPALSLTIKKLENELGYPVFERCGKEIGLTPVGEKYIRAIEAIMDIQQGLQKGIEDLVELRSGHVSLACATVISSYVLPDLIKEFRKHYPNVDFEVTVCEAADQERRVENGMVDIAIDGAVGRLAGMEYIPYFDEQLVLSGEEYRMYVTLGQFSIIRLERDAQLVVPVLEYSIPTKECCDNPGCAEDPCEMFSRIPFPEAQFTPTGCDRDCDQSCGYTTTGNC